MTHRGLHLLAGSMLIGLVLLTGAVFADAKDKVTVRLSWLYLGPDAPVFLAKERGYYDEAGLDVEIPQHPVVKPEARRRPRPCGRPH